MRKVSLEHSPARAFSASWAPDPRHIANQNRQFGFRPKTSSLSSLSRTFSYFAQVASWLSGVHAAEELAWPRFSLTSSLSHSALSTEAT